MLCSNCGATIPDGSTTCPNCQAAVAGGSATATATAPPPPSGATAASAGAKAYLDYARDAGLQAWRSLRQLAVNPVGGLDPAYKSLGDLGAMRVGIVFGIVSVICFLLGGYLMLPSFIRSDFFDILGFGGFMKLVFFACSPFVCATACSIGVRKAFGASGGIGGDCFIVGTALLPMSIWALIAGIVGYEHYNLIGVLLVFGLCIGILILYAGYTQVDGVSVVPATYMVPAVIVVSMWLTSLFGQSLTPSGPPMRSSPPPSFRQGGPSDSTWDDMLRSTRPPGNKRNNPFD